MEFASFVLAASTADLADEPAARATADAVEYRLDLADAPLERLAAYDGELPLIVTNRVVDEGGEAAADAARLDALEAAAEEPAVQAVDVELAALEADDADRVVETARQHGGSVIVSAHDLEDTPDPGTMVAALEAAADAGDLGKLAVTAGSPGDVLDLLSATWEVTRTGRRVAAMAMGEAGRHSRAVAPLYGSRVGYAPVRPDDATAPGQYDLETLRSLLDLLGVD